MTARPQDIAIARLYHTMRAAYCLKKMARLDRQIDAYRASRGLKPIIIPSLQGFHLRAPLARDIKKS